MTQPSAPAANNRAGKIVLALLFVGVLVAFFALGGDRWLSLDALREHRDLLLAYTRDHYLLMLLAAGAVYTAATAFSVPGAVILSLAVGFLFGRWVGTALILVSATIGAALVFLAARYLFQDAARERLGATGRRVVEGFRDNAFNYLLFLRLVPLFPFWLVNLVPALTGIRLQTYVAATAIGILPGTFVFANLGQSLGRIDSLEGLLSPGLFLAFALLGLLSLVPVLVKRFRPPTTPSV